MTKLKTALETPSRATVALGYPSVLGSIADHTEWLQGALLALPRAKRLSFVTHSLGGIVTRGLFKDPSLCEELQIHRIVMLAPPNQGASLTTRLNWLPLRHILGPSFTDLVSGVPRDLPTPNVPFIIFAGDAGRLRNPLIPGANDGLVGVGETELGGAEALHVVPSIHTFIMNHPDVVRGTDAFLTTD